MKETGQNKQSMETRHSEHIASQLSIMREPAHNCEFKQPLSSNNDRFAGAVFDD
jgi:hypothetical protein